MYNKSNSYNYFDIFLTRLTKIRCNINFVKINLHFTTVNYFDGNIFGKAQSF